MLCCKKKTTTSIQYTVDFPWISKVLFAFISSSLFDHMQYNPICDKFVIVGVLNATSQFFLLSIILWKGFNVVKSNPFA